MRLQGLSRSERNWGLLLAAPAVAGFLIFTLGPMIASFFIGLTEWIIGGTPSYVGFDNYATMLADDPLVWKSLGTTLYYALVSVPLVLLVSFLVALLLNRRVRGLGFYRTIFYLPVVVPFVASALLWLWIFNPDYGLLNNLLKAVGLPTSQWIFAKDTVVPSLMLMNVWAFGNTALIFLAGLQGVPRHLHEAVAVDGGNSWHQLWHVTIPMTTPTILFNLITGLIITFQEFARPYIMTEGGPGDSSLLYVYYIWRTAFDEGQMGYASALSWVMFAVILVFTLTIFRTARHWVYYQAGEGR